MVTPRKHLNSSLFVLHSSLHLIQRLRVFLRNILFYHQIFDDEVLALHRVLTHIIFQQLLHLIGFMQRNLLQPHVGTDEMGEFRVRTKVSDGLLSLLIAVAVMRDEIALFLLASQFRIRISHRLLVLDLGSLVAHSEQWGLKHVDMALLDEIWEELKEEGDDEQADVHSVDIRIGCHNHLVVTQ